jgi:hypothetical protein
MIGGHHTPHGGLQKLLDPQAVLASQPYIQDQTGRAVWVLAPQELAGGRKGFDLHPMRADEPS